MLGIDAAEFPAHTRRIAEQLNNRPRLRLDFMTPNDACY